MHCRRKRQRRSRAQPVRRYAATRKRFLPARRRPRTSTRSLLSKNRRSSRRAPCYQSGNQERQTQGHSPRGSRCTTRSSSTLEAIAELEHQVTAATRLAAVAFALAAACTPTSRTERKPPTQEHGAEPLLFADGRLGIWGERNSARSRRAHRRAKAASPMLANISQPRNRPQGHMPYHRHRQRSENR